MTREEYEKMYVRMMDSMRDDAFKGSNSCTGVECDKCPIRHICIDDSLSFNAFAIMEVVEKWGKEHPVTTNADKFEEVFGYKPNDPRYSNYPCPNGMGADFHGCSSKTCAQCKIDYWESEYVTPKKERKEE